MLINGVKWGKMATKKGKMWQTGQNGGKKRVKMGAQLGQRVAKLEKRGKIGAK